MPLRKILPAVVLVLALALPVAAQASSTDVIRDCAQDGKLNKHYSQKDLSQAEANLPSDIDEYTDCRSVIRAAMGGGSGSTSGPPPNGIVTDSGAVAGSPADVQALSDLTSHTKRSAIVLGNQRVLPGNAGLSGVLGGLEGSNGMPTALVVVIAAMAVLAVTTAYLAVREKIPLVRRAALRRFGR